MLFIDWRLLHLVKLNFIGLLVFNVYYTYSMNIILYKKYRVDIMVIIYSYSYSPKVS